MLKNERNNGIVYLAILLLLLLLQCTFWGYIAIGFYTQTGFLALLFGFNIGVICGLFIRKKNRFYFVSIAILATFLSVNLGLYIDFAYIEKSFLIEDSVLRPYTASWVSLNGISLSRYSSFLDYMAEMASIKVLFWHFLAIVTATYQMRMSVQIKSRFFRFKKFLISPKK